MGLMKDRLGRRIDFLDAQADFEHFSTGPGSQPSASVLRDNLAQSFSVDVSVCHYTDNSKWCGKLSINVHQDGCVSTVAVSVIQ